MAQKPTNTLPLTLIQPPGPPRAPGTVQGLLAWASKIFTYLNSQRTMLQSMYNSFVQSQASQNLVGLAADLPAPGTPGRQFLATDTKILYCDTGATWLKATLT